MNKLVKGIVSATPGPILAWVCEWIQIFEGTYILRNDAHGALTPTAISIGTVISVVLVYMLFNAQPQRLKRGAIYSGCIALFCVAMIFTLRYRLDASMPQQNASTLYTLYDVTTLLFLNAVLVTILLSVLYHFNLRGNPPPL